MSTDIVTRPTDVGSYTQGEITVLERLASHLAGSGFFKDAKVETEAFAKLVFGRDLGLGATQALTEIHIVEGKPELSANLQASMLRRYVGPDGERYDFRKPVHTAEVCKLVFRIRERGAQWEELGESEFTIDDAKLAGLVRPKSPWEKYPRNMLFARAMSNGVAWYCPEVTGGVRVYSPGEIGGEVVVDEPVQVAPPADVESVAVDEPVEEKRITEDMAREIIAATERVGIADRLQLAVAHLTGSDVGEITPDALTILTEAQAVKVGEWIERKAAEEPADAEVVA